MTPRTAAAAAVVALLLAISGCGGETTGDAAAPESQGTSAAGESVVTGVTVQQSGGLAGVRRTWQVSVGASNAEQVFDAASDDGFAAAAADDSAASTACCDFFSYDITVRYSDGSVVRVRTSDAQRHPHPAITRLLTAVLTGDPPRTTR